MQNSRALIHASCNHFCNFIHHFCCFQSKLRSKLYAQIDELRRELAHRGVETESYRQELQKETEAKVRICIDSSVLMHEKCPFNDIHSHFMRITCFLSSNLKKSLEVRVEELMAFLDRTKKFQAGASDPDAAVNMEYLKNCVYRFMATTEHSERKRLAPVISTILKLTSQERRNIQVALSANDVEEVEAALTSLGAIATSSLQSLFGFTATSNVGPTESGSSDATIPVPALGLRRGPKV
jgi:GRIP domain